MSESDRLRDIIESRVCPYEFSDVEKVEEKAQKAGLTLQKTIYFIGGTWQEDVDPEEKQYIDNTTIEKILNQTNHILKCEYEENSTQYFFYK